MYDFYWKLFEHFKIGNSNKKCKDLPTPDATRHPLQREGKNVSYLTPRQNKTHPNRLSQTILNRLFGRVLEKEGEFNVPSLFKGRLGWVSCAEHTVKNLFSYSPIHLFTSKKVAFTLAEVLITLAIIGVVAALTLPTLIQKYRYHVLEIQFKKQYSILQQALLNMQREEGQIITKNNYPPNTFAPKFFKQMQIILNCGSSGCEQMDIDAANGEYANLTSKVYKTFNKSRFAASGLFDDGQAMVSDGAFIMINHSQAAPTITITIDTNGYNKGPNIWGYDLFTFEILNDSGKLVPSGTKGTYFEAFVDIRCSKSSSDGFNGITCSYHALSDNNYWKNLP